MEFELSFVGILEISPYTKSEQPRIAGKHLTRHAKNGYSVVANIATLRSRASLFFEGRRPLPRSLDLILSISNYVMYHVYEIQMYYYYYILNIVDRILLQ